MSLPDIPDINPDITITFEDAVNLILASIALEEIGLSHIINAEGEKIQKAIEIAATIDDLIKVNSSVDKTLRNVIKKQILLQYKLEDTIEIIP